MKIIFMGTPDFSVRTLEALIQAGHEIVLAVTQPDKAKGRGKEMQFPPVKEMAMQHQIPVFQPKKIREIESIEKLKEFEADVMVVVAFGQILSKEVLEMTPYGCVNVHASLLPKYRGAAPIQWSILDGESVTGVTIMQMDEGIDTGDMLAETQIPIEETDTGGSLHDKLAKAGAALCVETLEHLKNKTITPKVQGESTTAYAKQIKKDMGYIDWKKEEAAVIERKIRAFSPWPSAYTYLNEKLLKIWKAEALAENTELEAGSITKVETNGFYIQTKEGQIKVSELQLQGKKRMSTEAFLLGYKLTQGEQLS